MTGLNQQKDEDKAVDREALFEQLVYQHQSQILRLCYMYLRDEEQARDAVQETFFRAYQHWDRFRGASSAKTWLTRIAINVCRDLRKTAWFRHVDRRITPEDLPDAVVTFTARDEELILQVMSLRKKQREVILLYYYQSMTVTEIAQILSISQSSVSGRLDQARKQLKSALEGSDHQ